MKKIYVLIVVCLCLAFKGFSQDFYWIGPTDGSWNSASNWSNTAGGPVAATFPQTSAHNAIFPGNATVKLPVSLSLNSLSVNGAASMVKITGTGGTEVDITVSSANVASPALKISAGCRLESDAEDETVFMVIFGANAQGMINGDWYFTGDVNTNALASFNLGSEGFTTRLIVNTGGSITVANNAYIEPNTGTGNDYLVFNAGAALNLQANGPIVPEANYNASSNINITGVTDAFVGFEETGSIGNITYNCPAQSNDFGPMYLSLLTFDVNGSVNIMNTNNQELALISFFNTEGLPSRNVTIKGDLNIQGNSKVAVANGGTEIPNYLYVQGNVIANGTSLDIQASNDVVNQPTVLFVKGNIQHTAGTLGASSSVVNQSTDLFVIEMNGSAPQTISSHSGTFDNAGNQVTLRINNAAGVSLLSSLSVGRLNFNTANKGILTTNANAITLNNTAPASVSNIVMNMPSNPSLGYVNGNIRRKSASVEPLLLPSGDAGSYGGVRLIPSSNAATTFEAKFTNSDHGGAFAAPVRGTAPYYWDIARIGAGADAAVQLNVPGAIPGALAGHDLIVAKFDGTAWVSTKGTTGLSVSPGNATSGTVRSEMQTSLGTYTIAFESEVALPTVLVSFTAKSAGKGAADLKWKITDNSTPSSFIVMRSADGTNFKDIGSVPGVEGKLEYAFSDDAMINGNNYYRLKMLDRDGAVTYSTILVVSNNGQGVLMNSLMPTVVNSRAKLAVSASVKSNMQLVITDINGRVMQSQTLSLNMGSQDIWIDASRLSAGMYQLTGYVAGEKTATIRFIKQ